MTDPLSLVREWYEEAVAAGLAEPNAMALATASSSDSKLATGATGPKISSLSSLASGGTSPSTVGSKK